MQDSDAGDVEVIDSEQSTHLEVPVCKVVVDHRIGECMRAVDQDKVECVSP